MADAQPVGICYLAQVLRDRDFAIYATGNTVSLVGTWMQRIATGWLCWELTGSGAWLGLIVFADLFPTVVVGPIAGATVDRMNRLTLVKITQVLGVLQALALVGFLAAGLMNIWILFVITLFNGTVAAFNMPARMAIVYALVPQSAVASAVSISSISFNLARFIGPALAGLLIVTGGIVWAYVANALTFAVFLVALMMMRIKLEVSAGKRGRLLADALDGLKYAAGHRGISMVLLLMLAIGLGARPVADLLPGFAADVFGTGADGLAVLSSSIAVGAILGGLWLGGRPGHEGLSRIYILCAGAMALGIILFTTIDSLWLAAPVLVAVGIAWVCVGVAGQTLVQMAVDDAMRGRVLSLYGLIFRGAPAVGALLMGVAADFVGLRLPLALGCVAVIACTLWIAGRRRQLAQSLEGAADRKEDAMAGGAQR